MTPSQLKIVQTFLKEGYEDVNSYLRADSISEPLRKRMAEKKIALDIISRELFSKEEELCKYCGNKPDKFDDVERQISQAREDN